MYFFEHFNTFNYTFISKKCKIGIFRVEKGIVRVEKGIVRVEKGIVRVEKGIYTLYKH